jgi:SAM-dependent methyltransferase
MTESTQWYENDEFWATLAPQIMFGQGAWERAEGDVKQLAALLPARTSVLDLGCGPGRHSLGLARQGFRVTALDRTDSYLVSASEQAARENLEIEFVRADMRRFVRPDSFGAVLSLSTSFGFFEDAADDRAVLVNAHRSLRDGGRLIMDMKGKEVLARSFVERTWFEQAGMLMLIERKVSREWSWVEDRWIVVKDGVRREYLMAHRPYSAAELRGLLRECGFTSVDIYGDLAGAKYDHNAARLVAVALK